MDDVKKPGKQPAWSVAQAKARLSEVIERARAGEPQLITRNGRKAVVVCRRMIGKRLANPSRLFMISCAPRRSLGSNSILNGTRAVREISSCEIFAGHQCYIRGAAPKAGRQCRPMV